MITWTSKKVRVSQLQEYEGNPRIITEKGIDDLKESITKFGVAEPIIVNKDYTIIGGHARKKTLQLLKIPEVMVQVPDRMLEDYEIKELNVRLNKNIAGEFDWEILANNYEVEDLLDWGFTNEELQFETEPEPEREDDDKIPTVEEATTKSGDLWILGDHRLLCGDATIKADVERVMAGETADICFTSPPYNVGKNTLGGNKNRIDSKYLNDSDNKKQDDWLSLISESLLQIRPFTTNQAFNIQHLQGNKVALIEFLYEFRNYLTDTSIWFKGGGQPAMADSVMNSRFEYIFIFSSTEHSKRKIESNYFRNISNVYELNPAGKNQNTEIHAAIFPVEFAEHYIGFLSENSVVDMFLGSGTTLITCEKINRKCYGMEIDPYYCDVIIKRWEDYTGQKAALDG